MGLYRIAHYCHSSRFAEALLCLLPRSTGADDYRVASVSMQNIGSVQIDNFVSGNRIGNDVRFFLTSDQVYQPKCGTPILTYICIVGYADFMMDPSLPILNKGGTFRGDRSRSSGNRQSSKIG